MTSRARQLQRAAMLVAGHGVITAEFFDAGESRMLPWARRPPAAALVAQLADPGRGWDAVVIGGVRAGVLREPVRVDGTEVVQAVAVSGDGTRAVTGSQDKTARVWDLASGRCEHLLAGPSDKVLTVAVSADGTRAVTGSENPNAWVWDLASESREHMLDGHTSRVQVVAVSGDGTRAVTGSYDTTARVWDLASGRCEHVLAGHTEVVWAVAVNGHGTRAVTGSWDFTARVWDLASGRCEHVLTGHTWPVAAVAVSADGTLAVTGQGSVRLWDLVTGQQIDQWQSENDITSLGGSVRLLRIVAGDERGQVHILDLGGEPVRALGSPKAEQILPRDRSPLRRHRRLAYILGFRRRPS